MRNDFTGEEIKNAKKAIEMVRNLIGNHVFDMDPKTVDYWTKVESEFDNLCYRSTGFHISHYPVDE